MKWVYSRNLYIQWEQQNRFFKNKSHAKEMALANNAVSPNFHVCACPKLVLFDRSSLKGEAQRFIENSTFPHPVRVPVGNYDRKLIKKKIKFFS
jgi:hypothetical protein